MPAVVEASNTFDWAKLGFALYPTNGYVSYTWKDGAWGSAEWFTEPYVKLHIANVAVNYGQSAFEGLKAFRGPDGHVRIFRPKDNSARLNQSADAASMPEVPESLFLEAIEIAVGRNLEFVPPHSPNATGGSMYVRPLLYASGPSLIPMPANEYQFIVYVTPTGSLYGAGGSGQTPGVDALVLTEFDRTAPRGTGNVKLAGNYAPTFKYAKKAKQANYGVNLHLDSQTRSFIDEFSTANFLGVKNVGDETTLVIPKSETILPSVTTKAIIDIAQSLGWKVERCPVPFQELIDGGFEEVAAAGTAAAVTAIRSVSYYEEGSDEVKKVEIGDGKFGGPKFKQVLLALTGVQSGIQKPLNPDDVWPAAGVDSSK